MGGPLSSAHGHREGLMPPLTEPLDWFIVTPTSTARFTTPSGTGTSRSRLRVHDPSAPQRMNHSQEHTLPLVPRQQPVVPAAVVERGAGVSVRWSTSGKRLDQWA